MDFFMNSVHHLLRLRTWGVASAFFCSVNISTMFFSCWQCASDRLVCYVRSFPPMQYYSLIGCQRVFIGGQRFLAVNFCIVVCRLKFHAVTYGCLENIKPIVLLLCVRICPFSANAHGLVFVVTLVTCHVGRGTLIPMVLYLYAFCSVPETILFLFTVRLLLFRFVSGWYARSLFGEALFLGLVILWSFSRCFRIRNECC